MFKKLRKKCTDPVYSKLLIEFRAVPYSSDSHVLEYRIDPNQNLTYSKKFKVLGIPFKLKFRYASTWIRAERFMNRITSYMYDANDHIHIMPIFVDTKDALGSYKRKYKTIGEFLERELLRYSEKEFEEYNKERAKYLERKAIWN